MRLAGLVQGGLEPCSIAGCIPAGGRTIGLKGHACLVRGVVLQKALELLDSLRGPKGGYRLGRPQRDIRLSEVIAVALADDEDGGHGPAGRLQHAVVDPLFAELDEAARAKLQALTLDDLLRRAAAAGLRRPAAEPISFAI